MRLKCALVASLVGLLTPFLALGQDKPADETIKVNTLLVSVPTIVSDRDGRYVPNLTQKDFTIFQDGQQQNIDFFAATEEPISVALLIDTSQSTRGVLGDIKDSAKSFIKLLTPKDKAMIVSFDYATHVLCPLTSDTDQLRAAVKSAEIPERGLVGTTLRDAVYDTINQTFAGLKGRKAIILLTDGKDFKSRIDTNTLLYSLQESDTLIYTVMFKTGDQNRNPALRQILFPPMGRGGIFGGGGRRFPGGGANGGRFPNPRQEQRRQQQQGRIEEQNEIAAEFLRQLSDTTAGRAFSSKDGKLKNTFASIVEELRFQYRLGYYPPEDSPSASLHQIKVKVNRADAVVRSRASYRAISK
ncbi:MAG: VWA domain-containing protein [Acidobacteria bacterium]|nr:VWA domain-containing protein [Acidobacteriota bacterium]